MSGILGFIIGVGVGVAGTLAIKGKGNEAEIQNLKNHLNGTAGENEKLRRRNKEAEHHIEDLESELEKLHRQTKSTSSDKEELQEELEEALKKVEKISLENKELNRKIEEYKAALFAAKNK